VAGSETTALGPSALLLAAVSHDLRTPLAVAKAAVSGLRSAGIQLTAEDHDDLLTTADESLDQLSHLLVGLLDVSRLQAGALPVSPRPAESMPAAPGAAWH
jgi:two-component system sensor histidine kinase KdpD